MTDDLVDLDDLKIRWDIFKRKRNSGTLKSYDTEFITMVEREQMIDMLFDYIFTRDSHAQENND